MALGEISSLEEGRQIVRDSFDPQIFEPRDGAIWDGKEAQFDKLPSA